MSRQSAGRARLVIRATMVAQTALPTDRNRAPAPEMPSARMVDVPNPRDPSPSLAYH